jgi:hypothetical protein
MSTIKFVARRIGRPIESVEVERETEQSVWVCGVWHGKKVAPRRHSKRSDWDNYFDTWEEAKAFLLANAERKVAHARRELEIANSELGNVKGLKPPVDAQEAE